MYVAATCFIVKVEEFSYPKKNPTKRALKVIADADGFVREYVLWPDYETQELNYPKELKRLLPCRRSKACRRRRRRRPRPPASRRRQSQQSHPGPAYRARRAQCAEQHGAGVSVATSNGSPTLWVGANAPTQQTSTGANQSTQYKVTVTQTQEQAYCSGRPSTSDRTRRSSSTRVWGARAPAIGSRSTTSATLRPGPRRSSEAFPRSGPSGDGRRRAGLHPQHERDHLRRASQVNAYALVASSLPINTNLVQRGLLNNPDDQFLFSTPSLASGSNGPTPVFNPSQAVAGVAPAQTPNFRRQPPAAGTATSPSSRATLTSPANQNVGGRVALSAPTSPMRGRSTLRTARRFSRPACRSAGSPPRIQA